MAFPGTLMAFPAMTSGFTRPGHQPRSTYVGLGVFLRPLTRRPGFSRRALPRLVLEAPHGGRVCAIQR